jgi:transcriptional regulator with XRE-family HTH domain
MEAQRIVGWNLRRIRVERGLSIEELAGQAEVDASYVARMERGTVNPSVGVVERLGRALGVALVEFFIAPPRGATLPKGLRAGRRPSKG